MATAEMSKIQQRNADDSATTTNAMEMALATLQPIRDLARNWDVDIASCLEEYLQELTGLSSSPLTSSGIQQDVDRMAETYVKEVPNFAHAALILQNSSHVYSRKVEYLHSLVYKALEEFFQATALKARNGGTSRRKTVDSDIDDFFDFDPQENFLLLDDVVPEDVTLERINLKDDDEDSIDDDNYLGMSRNAHRSNTPNAGRGDRMPNGDSRNNTRLSLGGLSVTRLERSMVDGSFSKQKQRALLGILNNGTLRLVDGNCDVGADGVLLMPGSQTSRTRGHDEDIHQEDDDGGQARSLLGSTLDQRDDEHDNGFGVHFGDPDDDDNDDGPGFVMHQEEPSDNDDEIANTFEGSKSSPSNKRVKFAEIGQNTYIRNQRIGGQERKDPWSLLDPHSPGDPSYTPKPLKKGKTIRLPNLVTMLPSECVTGTRTNRFSHTEQRIPIESPVRPSLAVESFRIEMGKQLEPSIKISFQGLALGKEFLYVAKAKAKLRAAKVRAEKNERKKLSVSSHQAATRHDADEDDDDDGDYGGGFYFGGADDDIENDTDDFDVGNSGMQTLDEAFQGSSDNQIGGLDPKVTFEELCRAHIQAFAKKAESFALSTRLTERVSKWQARLAPILEEEERKASFDIQQYSEMLIKNARKEIQSKKLRRLGSSEDTNLVNFEAVTMGCTRSDVCRYFLASLSLANSGNLKIEEGIQGYRFDILSNEVQKPMETFRAPSVAITY